MTTLDWIDHFRLLLRARRAHDLRGPEQQGHGGRLLPGGAQFGLVARRRLHFRVEHRFGTHRWSGRVRGGRRRGARTLRAARLVPARAGLGVRALLHAVDGLHDAGVPRTPVLGALALPAVRGLADLVHRLEDRRGHLRRRHRVRRVAAGAQRHGRPWHVDSFWIGSVLVIVATGLYTTLGGMRAVAYNDAVQVGIILLGSASLTFYGLNLLGGWGELPRDLRPGHVQSVEADGPSRCRRHVGAGHRATPPAAHASGVVLQRQFSVGGHGSSARRSSASGTGARTSTSFSACSAHRTRRTHDAGGSLPLS